MDPLRRLLVVLALFLLLASASGAQAQSPASSDDAALEAARDKLNRGEVDAAVADLNRFVDGTAADEKRAPSLAKAYDALVLAYYGTAQYRLAAETLAKIAANRRFDEPRRSPAAIRGIRLFLALGDRAKAEDLYRSSSRPPEASYAMASLHYEAWEAAGGDGSANTAERVQAEQELEQFHAANKGKVDPAPLVVEAAFRLGKMKRAAGNKSWVDWFRSTVDDWKFLKANPGQLTVGGSPLPGRDQPYRDYAAEADYALVDKEVAEKFDYATGHHHYAGTVEDVKSAVDKDLSELKKWQAELLRVGSTYQGGWQSAAQARIGTLYDSIWAGLHTASPNFVTTPQLQAKLAKFQQLAGMLSSGSLNNAACVAQFHVSCADAGTESSKRSRACSRPSQLGARRRTRTYKKSRKRW